MRILVLGAGGIGGYFGGRLLEGGADVTFLVRPRRRAQLQRDGLRVQSPVGDIQLPARTITDGELRPGYDLVLLTCKAYDLESAMTSVAPVVDGTCVIIPLLNGLAHVDSLDARFGRDRIAGGTCSINVALRPDGVVQHNGALQRLIFGERDGAQSTQARLFAEALSRTKVDWQQSNDVAQDLWEKIVFLSTLAGATCLFRGTTGEILAAPGGREAIERMLEAAVEIATREGHAPRPQALAFARNGLLDPAGTWNSSMRRDLEGGRQVESDHIIGWMLERARRHGIDATLLSLAFTQLKTYEARQPVVART